MLHQAACFFSSLCHSFSYFLIKSIPYRYWPATAWTAHTWTWLFQEGTKGRLRRWARRPPVLSQATSPPQSHHPQLRPIIMWRHLPYQTPTQSPDHQRPPPCSSTQTSFRHTGSVGVLPFPLVLKPGVWRWTERRRRPNPQWIRVPWKHKGPGSVTAIWQPGRLHPWTVSSELLF